MQFRRVVWVLLIGWVAVLPAVALAQETTPTVLDISFTPTRRAQMAIWVEDADGTFMTTVMLTDLVARLGIGNRPGASQMNSGYRWPYGRREGVLPVWGTRRANAPGAQQFRRVIFQNRYSEGRASRTTNDQSTDPYYCLSFNAKGSNRDSLDAVACASAGTFSSDKGRFITDDDMAEDYAEPFEDPVTQLGEMRPLSPYSLYPPRRDTVRCTTRNCFDHADLNLYRQHALEVMPELDAITTATLQGDVLRHQLFTVPESWPAGDYQLWVEINVEGDYNDVYNAETYRTPRTPAPATTAEQPEWDSWATNYGYPYRGQPSVVYSVPFSLGTDGVSRGATSEPVGAGSWDQRDPDFGTLAAIDTLTDDPENAPGSGADRLRIDPADGSRLSVIVRTPESCEGNTPPSAVSKMRVTRYSDFRHQHEWARLSFDVANDDDRVFRYEVRLSESPMVDAASFIELGAPAKSATTFSQELMIPADATETVAVDFGGMLPRTTYYLGVRAIDTCNAPGAIEFAEHTTTEQQFTTVTPCFIATAAYGSPLASEIGVLRRVRDRLLAPHAIGRALIDVYYSVGPSLAGLIADRPWLRDLTRKVLSPIVEWAASMDPERA